MQVARAWTGYCEARKVYRKVPSKFLGPSRIPGYKAKQTDQAIREIRPGSRDDFDGDER